MGNGALAIGPKLPRPSSTLPCETFQAEAAHVRVEGLANSIAAAVRVALWHTFSLRGVAQVRQLSEVDLP